ETRRPRPGDGDGAPRRGPGLGREARWASAIREVGGGEVRRADGQETYGDQDREDDQADIGELPDGHAWSAQGDAIEGQRTDHGEPGADGEEGQGERLEEQCE